MLYILNMSSLDPHKAPWVLCDSLKLAWQSGAVFAFPSGLLCFAYEHRHQTKACQALGWPRLTKKVSQPHSDEHRATGTNDLWHGPDVPIPRGPTSAISAWPEARGNAFQDRLHLPSCRQEHGRSLKTGAPSNIYQNITEESVPLKLHFLCFSKLKKLPVTLDLLGDFLSNERVGKTIRAIHWCWGRKERMPFPTEFFLRDISSKWEKGVRKIPRIRAPQSIPGTFFEFLFQTKSTTLMANWSLVHGPQPMYTEYHGSEQGG